MAAASAALLVGVLAAPASADVVEIDPPDPAASRLSMSPATAQALSTGSPTGAWFIGMDRTATALGGSAANVQAQQSSFMSSAASAGISIDVRQQYSTVWNGLSIEVADSDIDAILAMPGVSGAWPVEIVDAPETTFFNAGRPAAANRMRSWSAKKRR